MADLFAGRAGAPLRILHEVPGAGSTLSSSPTLPQLPTKTGKEAENTQLPPITSFYRVGFLLTSMVAGLSSVCIKQLLLPLQVSLLAPTQTNTTFALVSSLGALAGFLAAPLTGAHRCRADAGRACRTARHNQYHCVSMGTWREYSNALFPSTSVPTLPDIRVSAWLVNGRGGRSLSILFRFSA